MASSVALPLEKQFATIAGLDSLNSTSTQGSTNITLQFDLNRNIDAAAQDVQAMIARAARQLPPQMPSAPSYQKVNPATSRSFPARSATMPLSNVNECRDDRPAHLDGQRRRPGAGVGRGQVCGARGSRSAQALVAGIGIDDGDGAIQSANVNLPTGTMCGRTAPIPWSPTAS